MLDQTIDTSAPEVFALTPCVIDSVSVSGGLLCLVMPNGDAVRVPVKPEKVAEVARALMARPTVLLLAREGVVLPQALPAPAEGDVDRRFELVALKRAVFAAAEGRSFDPDGVDPENRDIVLALQRMSNAVVAQATCTGLFFDPAVHVTRAEVVDALKVTHDSCKYLDDQRKVAALVARFSTVTSEVPA